MRNSPKRTKIQMLLFAVVIGLAAVFVLLGLLGRTSVVLAKEQKLTATANLAPMAQQPQPQIFHVVVFTDPALHVVQDLSGNVVGQAAHTGEVKCRDGNCNKKINLYLIDGTDRVRYEYQFKSLQALDPEGRRSVVAGTGTIYNGSQKSRFLVTATFEDNRDGTIAVTYVASRPDASFMIPGSPGKFEITSR